MMFRTHQSNHRLIDCTDCVPFLFIVFTNSQLQCLRNYYHFFLYFIIAVAGNELVWIGNKNISQSNQMHMRVFEPCHKRMRVQTRKPKSQSGSVSQTQYQNYTELYSQSQSKSDSQLLSQSDEDGSKKYYTDDGNDCTHSNVRLTLSLNTQLSWYNDFSKHHQKQKNTKKKWQRRLIIILFLAFFFSFYLSMYVRVAVFATSCHFYCNSL